MEKETTIMGYIGLGFRAYLYKWLGQGKLELQMQEDLGLGC